MSYLLEPFVIPLDGCVDPRLTLLKSDQEYGVAQRTPARSVGTQGGVVAPEDRVVTGSR